LQSRAALSFAAPPVWFLALEQAALGHRDAFVIRLASLALLGLASTVFAIAGCYLTIYRRFDQLVLRSSHVPWRRRRWPAWLRLSSVNQRPARRAIAEFTATTLRRSGLHQVVFCSLSAIGAAVSINSVAGFDAALAPRGQAATAWRFAEAVLEMPLVFFFFGVAAARSALLLPLDVRANWLFRITEDPGAKCDQLAAVERSLIRLGVAPYLVISLVIQTAVLGAAALRATIPTMLLGLLLVEWVLRHWHRIPFTCTYIPGKRQLVHTLLLTFASFVVFVNIGGGLIHFSLTKPRGFVILCAVLLAVFIAMRRSRLTSSARVPLEFEDSLPDDVTAIPFG